MNKAVRSDAFSGSAVRAEADGTITFPLSSEEPFRRYDGDEILVHNSASVDLEWLNSGNAPLLDNHNRYDGIAKQIGVITKAWLEAARLYVTVRFSARQEAQAAMQDVIDGILRNVSVGYDILKVERDEGKESYRVTSWRPTEASFVPVPADRTVGIGRSAHPLKEAHMPEDQNKAPGEGDRVMPGMKTEAQRAEEFETSLNEIRALAAQHNIGNIGESFIDAQVRSGGVPSIEVFRGIARANVPADKPLRNEDIGLSTQETRQFSIVRLANAMREGANSRDVEDASFEIEACRAAADASGRATKGSYTLPSELMNSWGDFEVGGVRSSAVRAPLSAGGNPNVQNTVHLAGRFIDNLRNRLVLGQLGITVLTGLEGNVEIPGGDQNSQAAWLGSEDADAAETTPTFRKVSLDIHDVAAYTDLTRRMLMQSTIDIEMYARAQLETAMAEAIDLAGWYGQGTGGIPEGLANTTGIGSVTFAGPTPTRNELIDMRSAIATTNQFGSPQFVGNTALTGELMKAKVDDGSGMFLMTEGNRLHIGNGFSETNQIVDGDVFAGVFSDMLMGMWGTLELDRSTEAKFLSGGVRLRAIQSVDFAVARVGSFVYGNDGA